MKIFSSQNFNSYLNIFLVFGSLFNSKNWFAFQDLQCGLSVGTSRHPADTATLYSAPDQELCNDHSNPGCDQVIILNTWCANYTIFLLLQADEVDQAERKAAAAADDDDPEVADVRRAEGVGEGGRGEGPGGRGAGRDPLPD